MHYCAKNRIKKIINRRKRRVAAIFYKKFLSLCLAGAFLCFSPSSSSAEEVEIVAGGEFQVAKLNQERLLDEYRLNKYDVINVLVVGFPNGIGVDDILVGVDGYAQLPYVGAVKLAGLTLEEATELLTERMGEYIKIPSMSIVIKSYGPRKVYVMGSVNSPGIKEMSIDSLNAYAAISAAGGVDRRGRPKHVQVLRNIGDTMYYKEINLDAFVKKHDMTQNLVLEDGDIVYVPKSNKIIFSEDIMPYISLYAMYDNLTD